MKLKRLKLSILFVTAVWAGPLHSSAVKAVPVRGSEKLVVQEDASNTVAAKGKADWAKEMKVAQLKLNAKNGKPLGTRSKVRRTSGEAKKP